MTTIDLSHSKTNHTQRLVQSLAQTDWHATAIPARGMLESNHQLMEFRTPRAHLKVRVSVFAVGDRGESHRRDERRIQITTTYLSGLKRLSEYRDVVLGYDSQNNAYVGLDPRRLEFGGQKHNASSSVDPTALEHASGKGILIRPHDTQILGLEYQAIFMPERLAEYIFNAETIHRGLYVGGGPFSGLQKVDGQKEDALAVPSGQAHGEVLVLATSAISRSRKVKKSRITAYESGNWKALANVSPEELEEIRRRCAEIGDRGEYVAFRFEKQRLRKAGKEALARKVDWVSRRAVGKGYDIKSYETDDSPRYVEVKSTAGRSMTFFMSEGEWKVAARERNAYYIYRIVDVDRTPIVERIVQDPVSEEKAARLKKTASGWKVELK